MSTAKEFHKLARSYTRYKNRIPDYVELAAHFALHAVDRRTTRRNKRFIAGVAACAAAIVGSIAYAVIEGRELNNNAREFRGLIEAHLDAESMVEAGGEVYTLVPKGDYRAACVEYSVYDFKPGTGSYDMVPPVMKFTLPVGCKGSAPK